MCTLDKALAIAVRAHGSQVDKGGHPYILHVLRVVLAVPPGSAQVVAALHDVVEDSDLTPGQLESEGFGAEVVDAVEALTHRRHEPYSDYIQRVSRNSLAGVVKVADLVDNLDRSRISYPSDRDLGRWKKYELALGVIRARLSA